MLNIVCESYPFWISDGETEGSSEYRVEVAGLLYLSLDSGELYHQKMYALSWIEKLHVVLPAVRV